LCAGSTRVRNWSATLVRVGDVARTVRDAQMEFVVL
jgi:hypothetical protein